MPFFMVPFIFFTKDRNHSSTKRLQQWIFKTGNLVLANIVSCGIFIWNELVQCKYLVCIEGIVIFNLLTSMKILVFLPHPMVLLLLMLLWKYAGVRDNSHQSFLFFFPSFFLYYVFWCKLGYFLMKFILEILYPNKFCIFMNFYEK